MSACAETEDFEEMNSVYKTILLFLESHNLINTYQTMLTETACLGHNNIEACEPKILILRPCRCELLNFPYSEDKDKQSKSNEAYMLEAALSSNYEMHQKYMKSTGASSHTSLTGHKGSIKSCGESKKSTSNAKVHQGTQKKSKSVPKKSSSFSLGHTAKQKKSKKKPRSVSSKSSSVSKKSSSCSQGRQGRSAKPKKSKSATKSKSRSVSTKPSSVSTKSSSCSQGRAKPKKSKSASKKKSKSASAKSSSVSNKSSSCSQEPTSRKKKSRSSSRKSRSPSKKSSCCFSSKSSSASKKSSSASRKSSSPSRKSSSASRKSSSPSRKSSSASRKSSSASKKSSSCSQGRPAKAKKSKSAPRKSRSGSRKSSSASRKSKSTSKKSISGSQARVARGNKSGTCSEKSLDQQKSSSCRSEMSYEDDDDDNHEEAMMKTTSVTFSNKNLPSVQSVEIHAKWHSSHHGMQASTEQMPIAQRHTQTTPCSSASSMNYDATSSVSGDHSTHVACTQAALKNSAVQMGDYFELDYNKIKAALKNGKASNAKCELLQALRWRITQSSLDVRNLAIDSYIDADILGLKSNDGCIKKLYASKSTQLCIARFVNAIASLSSGRNYLVESDCFIVDLIYELMTDKSTASDKVVMDHLLATLQKLSLRETVREKLISLGFADLFLDYLSQNHSSMSGYSLEYSMALFMNLCLSEGAIEQFRQKRSQVIDILVDVMKTRREFCLPYVTGALFNLLTEEDINDHAKETELAKVLQQHMHHSTGMVKSQLEFILDMHTSNNSQNHRPTKNLNDSDEVDHIEAELDTNDQQFGVAGEKLLESYAIKSRAKHENKPRRKGSSKTCGSVPKQPRASKPKPKPTKAKQKQRSKSKGSKSSRVSKGSKKSNSSCGAKKKDEKKKPCQVCPTKEKPEPCCTKSNKHPKDMCKTNKKVLLTEFYPGFVKDIVPRSCNPCGNRCKTMYFNNPCGQLCWVGKDNCSNYRPACRRMANCSDRQYMCRN